VHAARFSPDGETVVVASEDGLARVWSTPSGASIADSAGATDAGVLLFSLQHAAAVRDAVYSPDGVHIATASEDGTALLWNARDGEPSARMVENQSPLVEVRFSDDGEHVAVRADSGKVFLCDPHGVRATRQLETRTPAVSMAWLTARSELMTGHAENALRIFAAREGNMIGERKWLKSKSGLDARPVALDGSPDGSEMAVACADGLARFFAVADDARSRPELKLFPPHSIEYNSDGSRLLVTGRVGRSALRLMNPGAVQKRWDEVEGEIGQRKLHAGDVTGGAFSPDGKWVITTATEGGAFVRDARNNSLFAHFSGRGGACFAGAISPGPGASRALVAFDDGTVWIWPLDPLPAAKARLPEFPSELVKILVEREKQLALPLIYQPLERSSR